MTGCETIAFNAEDRELLSMPEVEAASGGRNEEFLGLHIITTGSVLRGTTTDAGQSFEQVDTISEGGWSLQLYGLTGDDQSLQWIKSNVPAIGDGFRGTARTIRDVFPKSSGRRFRIYLVPNDQSFQAEWYSIRIDDDDLPLMFAYHLPSIDARQQDRWVVDFVAFLAHEYSHSYFWFHKDGYRNKFSDEVVAYTVQRCVQSRVAPMQRTLADGFVPFFNQVRDLSPGEIHARWHDRYPDTYLGNVVSEILFRKALGVAGGDSARLMSYCEAVVGGGSDYARGD
jgi:hypothetical protein